MGVDLLCSPEMTGMWEYRLKQMEHGQFDRESFMQDVRELTRDVVNRAREHARKSGERTYPDLTARCPRCQASPLKQDDRTFRCTQPGCGFVLWKVIAGRELQPNEAVQLLSSGMVGPLDGFRSRRGTPFSAALQLSEEAKVTFVTTNGEEKADEKSALTPENYVCDYTLGDEIVGKIYEAPSAYVLDAAVLGNEKFRKVRLAKTLCRYRIPRDQAVKFFTEGKTGLIETFISKKGRPFKAHLVMDAEGKRFVNWEFPPRAAGKGAGGKKPAAKKSDAGTGAGRKTGSRGAAKKKSRKGSKSGARAVRTQALDEASNA
jgi:DNA topoisomerase-3